jgi:hypothetical protein
MGNAEKYKVITLAGSKISGNPTDGPGVKATFTRDLGTITSDGAGNLFVIDRRCVRKISPDGTVTTLLGRTVYDTNGNEKETEEMPSELKTGNLGIIGLIVDKKNGIYLCSPAYKGIFKIGNQNKIDVFAGGGSGSPDYATNPNGDGNLKTVTLQGPCDMGIDKAGNIYLNDKFRMVRKISGSGQVTTIAGKASDVYIGRNAEEPIYKSGTGNNASFANIGGIAVDSKGNIFVSQPDIFCILKVTPNGTVSTFAGDPNSTEVSSADGKGTSARFLAPATLAMDGSDNIYVADKRKVRMITPAGVVTTIAGASKDNDFTPAFSDGDGSVALFTSINGISCDGAGNIYVTDEARVRKIAKQ